MHNLSTVIKFEVIRTLKKKTFWILVFGFPVMFASIIGIITLSNQATETAVKDIEKQQFQFVVRDESGLVNQAIVQSMTGKIADPSRSDQSYIDAVRSGTLDGFIHYPSDLEKQPILTYGKNVDIFTDGRYSGVANTILTLSTPEVASGNVRAVLGSTTKVQSVVYRNGAEYDAIKNMIFPGLFLVLFYFLIAFFGNQMLTSTTEEKENRVIEMLLTTVNARTLIVGKILSLIVLAIIQSAAIIIPAFIGYSLMHDALNLPLIDLASLPVDWPRILVGFVLFTASFLLFTGLLVAVGAAVPTAKEAGGFFGIVMMLIFGPLYAASLFVSSPGSPLVQFLSFFPFTAPIPLLLRNALGNLSYQDAAIAATILIITATLVMQIAVRIFRYGALEYSRRLSLKEIFSRR